MDIVSADGFSGRPLEKRMKRCMTLVVLSTAVLAVHAQVPDQIRQATISGSRGTSGKCTIEVRVDIAAEVDVYGNSGRLRTVAGQPATWTRMECTDPLPYSMSDFRLRGIDGRGKVQLAQDPRNNNSMAVIRIDDQKAGSEGYTFDIEWSGASGGAPTGGFPTGGYYPSTSGTYPTPAGSITTGNTGRSFPGRRSGRNLSAERAIDLCRTEVRTRAQRDYSLRNIDVTAAAVDTNTGRSDWVTGTFNDRGGYLGRASGYRFNCAVDYNSGQVRTVEILRADGSVVQPGTTSGTYGSSTTYNQSGYDQNRVFRACQDAIVARTARDGYQNVSFSSTAVDANRSGWVSGTITAVRASVNDVFDFGCSMDFGTATVRNVELNRR
jgi:hypothetical protein